MEIITIDQARDHCKADSADDNMLTIYGNAAEQAIGRLVNRGVYPTAEARSADITAKSAELVAAFTAYDTAVEAADAVDDDRVREMMLASAEAELSRAKSEAGNAIHGIVANDDLKGAIFLVLGHLWANRETTVVGPSLNAVAVPFGAENLAWPYRRLGLL